LPLRARGSREVVRKDTGVRTARRISHVFVMIFEEQIEEELALIERFAVLDFARDVEELCPNALLRDSC
jgi:hypothetical protein